MVIKICRLEKRGVSRVFIFAGEIFNGETEEQLTRYFRTNSQQSRFSDIVSTDELREWRETQTEVYFVDDFIYSDDTIDTVRRKLFLAQERIREWNELPVTTMAEQYLFGIIPMVVDLYAVYQYLTQQEQIPLTQKRLFEWMVNIQNLEASSIERIPNKSTLTYTDVLASGLDQQTLMFKIPVGQKVVLQNNYVFPANPFDMTTAFVDTMMLDNMDNMLSTQNQSLLFQASRDYVKGFSYMNLGVKSSTPNILYVCYAEDVAQYLETTDIPFERQSSLISLYFPFLKDISDMSDFSRQIARTREKRLSEEEKRVNSSVVRQFDGIRIIKSVPYRDYISSSSTSDAAPFVQGIAKVQFTLNQAYSHKMPLEQLFRYIHASSAVPMIKYNPGRRMQNLYRLYAVEKARDGRKIPALTKATILRLKRTLSTEASVGLYAFGPMNINIGDNIIVFVIPFIIEIFREGSVRVTFDLELLRAEIRSRQERLREGTVKSIFGGILYEPTEEQVGRVVGRSRVEDLTRSDFLRIQEQVVRPISKARLSKFFIESCNPVLSKINEFLQASGLSIPYFNGFRDVAVDIEQLSWLARISPQNELDLRPNECTSLFANVLKPSIGTEDDDAALMRYKRVAYFNEMDSQSAMILEMIRTGEKASHVVSMLQENFNLSLEQANLRLSNVLNEIQIDHQDMFARRRLRIKTNPGFHIRIVREIIANEYVVQVDRITDFEYIGELEKFIGALVAFSEGHELNKREKKNMFKIAGIQAIFDRRPNSIS